MTPQLKRLVAEKKDEKYLVHVTKTPKAIAAVKVKEGIMEKKDSEPKSDQVKP